MFSKPLKLNTAKNRTKKFFGYLVLFAAIIFVGQVMVTPFSVKAAVPKVINFQGKLTKTVDGTNVVDGNYSMQFKIYDSLSGGSLLWTETWDGASGTSKVNVTNGTFSAKLGSYTSLSTIDFSGGNLYLTVNFNPGTGYDGEMSPRKQLVSSAFAILANGVNGDGNINIINTGTAASAAIITYNPSASANNNALLVTAGVNTTGAAFKVAQNGSGYAALFTGGNVGIGTTSPTAALFVQGSGATNPFAVVSSAGAPLVTVSANGSTTISSLSQALPVRSTAGGSLFNGAINLASSDVTGILSVSNGGTGANSTSTAFNNLSPLTTKGDLLTFDGTNDIRLGVGSSGLCLTASSTAFSGLAWSACSAGSITGAGINGYVPRWTSASTLATGILLDNGTVAGVNATSSSYTFNIQAGAGQNAFQITSSSPATTYFVINSSGFVGIGTTTPGAMLTVAGGAQANYFTSTDATATNTLVGNLNVNNGAISYDVNSNVTSIDNLQLGSMTFDANAGQVSWMEMPVTASATAGTIESYTAQLNGNPMLTIYAESDGLGGIQNARVGIGTTTPVARLSVAAINGADQLFDIASTTGISLLRVTNTGNVGIGTTTPGSLLTVRGTTTTTSLINIASSSGASLLWMGANGNLGIGTTSPQAMLDIGNNGVTTGTLRVESNVSGRFLTITDIGNASLTQSVGGIDLTTGQQNLHVGGNENSTLTTGNYDFTIMGNTNHGNVGVGTTTPTQKLVVSGNAYITGSLYDSTYSAGTSGQILSSTGSGTTWISTSTLVGGNALVSLNGQTGSVQTFATSTSGGLNLVITSAANVHTFTLQPAAGYTVPLTASTTQWNNFYNSPISNLTAGSNIVLSSTSTIAVSATPSFTTVTSVNAPSISGYHDISNNNLLTNGDFETGNVTGWIGLDAATTTVAYSGKYSAVKAGSNTVLSDDYIPVNPATDVLQLEGWFNKVATGTTPGTIYFGYIAYDANRVAITTAPCGTYCYFAGAGATIPADGVWHKFSATTNGEGTVYPDFPVGTKFVKVLVLINYAGSADTITAMDHVTLRRINYGPLFVGNNFTANNMVDQNQVSKVFTSASNVFTLQPTAGGSFAIASSSGASLFTVLANGNVGIGTAAPLSLLTLRGTTTTTSFLNIASSSGTSLLWMGANGSIGLNTTTPLYPLDIVSASTTALRLYKNNAGADSASALLTLEQGGTGDVGMDMLLSSGTRWRLGIDNSDGDKFKISSAASFTTGTKFTIDTSGNVGIGTSSPAYTGSNRHLVVSPATGASTIQVVSGSSDSSLTLYSGLSAADNPSVIWQAASSLRFGTASTSAGTAGYTERMRITGTGNVGIGTSNPANTLSVSGNSNITGGLSVGPSAPSPIVGGIYLDRSSSPFISFSAGGTSIGQLRGTASNRMAITNASGGTEFLSVLTDTGTVGVGTTTPTQKLVVSGNAYITGSLYDSTYSAGTSGQILSSTGSGTQWVSTTTFGSSLGAFIQGGNTFAATGTLGTLDNNALSFITNSTAKMTITSGGIVGIGTVSPNASYKLNVIGNTLSSGNVITGNLSLGYGLGLGQITTDSGAKDISILTGAGGAQIYLQHSSGNVGIGTTTPAYKMDIAGNNYSGLVDTLRIQNYSTTAGSDVALVLSPAAAWSGMTESARIVGYAPGANNAGIKFMTNNAGASTTAVTIQPGGNVGIGITSPSALLHVAGTTYLATSTGIGILPDSARLLTLGNNTVLNNPQLRLAYGGGSSAIEILGASVSNQNIWFGTSASTTQGRISYANSSDSLNFFTNGSGASRLTISSAGNIGIGTTTPAYVLSVNSSNTGLELFNSGTNGGDWVLYSSKDGDAAGGGLFTIRKAGDSTGSSKLVIDTNGNIGIGTTSPSQLLTVGNNNQFTVDSSGNTTAASYNATSANGYKIGTGLVLATLGSDTMQRAISAGGIIFNVNGATLLSQASMYINSSGNVGISTTTPTQKLVVSGNAYITGQLFDSSYNAGTSGQVLSATGSGTAWVSTSTFASSLGAFIQGGNSFGTTATLGTNDSNALAFETNNTTRMTILASGNIGINTINPQSQLDVSGSVTIGSYAGTNAAPSNGMIVSGNVGIGTNNPGAYKLNVSGNTNITGSLTATSITGVKNALNSVTTNIGSPTIQEMALFQGEFTNKLRFVPATLQEESTDGSTWATSSRATANQLADIMLGEGQVGGFTAIPAPAIGGSGYYRLTWDNASSGVGYVFLNDFYSYNSTNGNNVTFTIEAYHNTNGWATIASGAVNNWPGHVEIPHTGIAFSTNAVQYGKVRVTFSIANATYTNGFSLYSIEWFGGYPAGKRNVETYDRNKNVTFPAGIAGTQLTAPTLLGGSSATSDLNLQTTSGVGTAGADMHFLVGNNGGTEAMTILNSGNIGIGTTIPASLLTVRGTTTTTSLLNVASSSGASLLWIGANGNLGVNTTTPQANLVIVGTPVGNNFLVASSSGASQFVITSGGSVGIGTGTPSQNLVVSGNAYITGSLYDSTYSAGTSGQILSSTGSGTQWVSTTTFGSSLGAFIQGGNSFGTTATLGTNDSNALAFETNNTTQMTILTSGNVGIGTTTPGAKLDVWGGSMRINSGGTGYTLFDMVASSTLFRIGKEGSTGGNIMTGSLAGAGILNVQDASALQFGTGNTVKMTILNSGNVGIGTTSPDQLLTLNGGTNTWESLWGTNISGIKLNTNGTLAQMQSDNSGNLSLFSSGSVYLGGSGSVHQVTIANSGNVGIGTTGPLSKLEVVGSANGTTSSPILHLTRPYNSGTAWTSSFDIALRGGTVAPISVAEFKMLSTNQTGDTLGDATIMTLQSNGNVGIGTTGPSVSLDINGASSAVSATRLINVGNSGADGAFGEVFRMGLGNYSGTSNWRNSIYSSVSNTASLGILKFSLADSQTTQKDVMTLLNNGNVGIGTTTPSQKLEVVSLPGYVARFGDGIRDMTLFTSASGNGYGALGMDTVGNDLRLFVDNNATRGLTVQATTGNVGIGTTSPASLLHIQGTLPQITFTDPGSLSSTAQLGLTNTINSAATMNFGFAAGEGSNRSFNFRANGLNIMTILGTGNVGIGTTTPAEKLQINAGNILLSNQYALRTLTSTGANTALIAIDPSDYNTIFSPSSTSGVKIKSATSADLVTILNNGNVGVGTASPAAKLDVEGPTTTSATVLKIGNTTGSYNWLFANAGPSTTRINLYGYNTSGTQTISIDPTSNVIFNTGGNVGIGTATPSQLLSVAGNMQLTGALYDGTNNSGTLGMLLQSTASGVKWVATSTLGISSSLSGGTTGALAVWSSPTTLTSGLFLDNGTVAGVNATSSSYVFNIQGSANPLLDVFNVASSSGSPLFTVRSNGNIGIGTTGPTSLLTVQGSPSTVSLINVASSSGASLLWMGSNGRLGVGTATPGALLALQGTATSDQLFDISSATGISLFHITSGGNVGIGTSSPTALLEIVGDATKPALKVTSGYVDVKLGMQLPNSIIAHDLLMYLPFNFSPDTSRRITPTVTRADSASGATATFIDDNNVIIAIGSNNWARTQRSNIGRGVWVEDARRNMVLYSSFENGGTPPIGWTASGLTAAASTVYRLHGSYSAQLTTTASAGQFYRATTAALTSGQNYPFTAYVFNATTGSNGSAVDATIASLYSSGTISATTYTNLGGGWWKMQATLTGTGAIPNVGVQVEASHVVYVDSFQVDGTTANAGVNYPSTYIYNTTVLYDRGAETIAYPALINYGKQHITQDKGSVSFWFNSEWGSTDVASTDKPYFMEVGSSTCSDAAASNCVLKIYYNGADDKIYAAMYNGSDYTTAEVSSQTLSFAENTDHYVNFRWNSYTGSLSLLVDGQDNSNTVSSWTAPVLNLSHNIYLGSPASGTVNRANSLISDVSTFSRDLTGSEAQQIYHDNAPIQDFQRSDVVMLQQGAQYQYGNIRVTGAVYAGTFSGNVSATDVSTTYVRAIDAGFDLSHGLANDMADLYLSSGAIISSKGASGTFTRGDSQNGVSTYQRESDVELAASTINSPRFDRGSQPVSYASKGPGAMGLWMENDAQNIALDSSFENGSPSSNWTPESGLTVTADTTYIIHGNQSAKLVNGAAVKRYYQVLNPGSATQYQISAYAYLGNPLAVGNAVAAANIGLYAGSNLTGGALTTTYTSVGKGWYRLTATATSVASNWYVGFYVPASQTVYVDAIQVENPVSGGTSYYPTSYIPTSAAVASRAPETLIYPAPSGLAPERGTFSVWFKPDWARNITGDTGNKFLFEITNYMRAYLDGTNDRINVDMYNGSAWVTVINTAANAVTQFGWNHLAVSWNNNGAYAGRLNGVVLTAGATTLSPQNPTNKTLYIGSDSSGNNQADALVSSLTFYTRILDANETYQLYNLNSMTVDYYSGTNPVLQSTVGTQIIQSGSLNISGSILAGLGSAALPAYTFGSDSNTGLFSPASDILAVATGGVERLRIDSAGNVGIGTTTPSSLLTLQGTTTTTSLLNVASSSGASLLWMGANGNLGIGTAAPTQKLVVNGNAYITGSLYDSTYSAGTSGQILSSTGSGTAWVSTTTLGSSLGAFIQGGNSFGTTATLGTSDNNALAFETSGNTQMTILVNGNVGIGTNNPTFKLDISGGMARSYTSSSDAGFVFGRTGGKAGIMAAGTAGTGFNFDSTGQFAIGSSTRSSIDSGIYSGTDLFTVNGAGLVTIAQNLNVNGTGNNYLLGNVGIGTTNPNYKLEVAGSASTTTLYLPQTTSSSVGVIYSGGNKFIHNFKPVNNDGANIFVGVNAGNFTMGSSTGASVMGSYNTGIGQYALTSNTTGYRNTALGYATLYTNSTGVMNTALGYAPLYSNTTGSYNTASGYDSLYFNTTGSSNTASGYNSLTANTTGGANVALGFQSGYGDGSLIDNRSVVDANMLFLGTYASRDASVASTTSLVNGIAIGYNSKVLASNQVVLGNDSITTTLLKGNVGIGTSSPTGKLQVETSSGDQNVYFLATGATSKSQLSIGKSTNTDNRVVFGWNNSNASAPYGLIQTSSGTYPLTLQAGGGNVGIGTTAPSSLLMVQANSSYASDLFDVSTSSGASYLHVTAAGKVGIGTTSPIASLHVPLSTPNLTSTVALASGAKPWQIVTQGRYAYVANHDGNTIQIFDLTNPASPVSVSTTTVLSGCQPISVAVSGSYLYTVCDNSNRFLIYNIDNPSAPVMISNNYSGNGPQYMAISGKYAYIGHWASGFRIYDVSNPYSVGAMLSTTGEGGSHPREFKIKGKYAYILYYATDAMMTVDISNPTSPVIIATTTTDHFPYSIDIQDRYAYVVNAASSTMEVFDISNPASPALVSRTAVNTPHSVQVQNRYAFVGSATGDNFSVFDVSNPSAPAAVSTISVTGGRPFSMTVQGRYLYVVNQLVNTLTTYDLGGSYIQSLESGDSETGTLAVRGNAQIVGDLFIGAGLQAAAGAGFMGPVSINASVPSNTSVFNITTGTSTNNLFTVLGNGNIGIGTASPTSLLTLQGTTTTTSLINIASSSGASLLWMGANGNVGVGTTVPTELLHIAGNIKADAVNVVGTLHQYYSGGGVYLTGNSGSSYGAIGSYSDNIGTARILAINPNGGNVGIGTTAPISALSIQGATSATGANAVAGLFANTNLALTTNGGYEFGNRLISNVVGIATGTYDGLFIRMNDNTTATNTVRGLEIQAYSGSNTLGVNAGITSFGHTFGVQGSTDGLAGSIAQPAGVYAELTNATVGNALRAYSKTVTTASLTQIYQESSAFSGTGLLMNFGNNSGSFSGKFIDLQIAGTSKMSVSSTGKVTASGGFSGQCLSSGTFGSSTSASCNMDVAEVYHSSEPVAAGDVVILDTVNTLSENSSSTPPVRKAAGAYDTKLLGVVATAPGLILGTGKGEVLLGGDSTTYMEGDKSSTTPAVALVGRVPVKVTNENGNIQPGDFLTSSAKFAGYAMKATRSGYVLGQALEAYSSSTTNDSNSVLTYVNPGYQNINNTFVLGGDDGQLSSATSTQGVAQATNLMLSGQSFLINQNGSGNLLQIQKNSMDKFVINNSGVIALFGDATTATSSILSVYNGTTTVFSINAVGSLYAAGHIMVGPDTAGTATIKAGNNEANVSFSLPYDSIPKIIVTPDDVPVTFAVRNKTTGGFSIVINEVAAQDINFDWFTVEQPTSTPSTSDNYLPVLSSPAAGGSGGQVLGTSVSSGSTSTATTSDAAAPVSSSGADTATAVATTDAATAGGEVVPSASAQ